MTFIKLVQWIGFINLVMCLTYLAGITTRPQDEVFKYIVWALLALAMFTICISYNNNRRH